MPSLQARNLPFTPFPYSWAAAEPAKIRGILSGCISMPPPLCCHPSQINLSPQDSLLSVLLHFNQVHALNCYTVGLQMTNSATAGPSHIVELERGCLWTLCNSVHPKSRIFDPTALPRIFSLLLSFFCWFSYRPPPPPHGNGLRE